MKRKHLFLVLLALGFVLQLFNTFFTLYPFPGLEFLKVMFPALLLLASFIDSDPKLGLPLILYRVGLFFTLIGDYFLGIPNTPYFYFGMAGFAVGYLLYALTTRPQKSFPFILLISFSISIIQFITLDLSDAFKVSLVIAYMFIITFLLAGGWSQWIDRQKIKHLLIAFGFTFIYISDSMIGQDVFGSIKISQIPILLTYDFGQTLIALGFWRQLRDS